MKFGLGLAALVLVLMPIPSRSAVSDSDRINLLENEIRDLKIRISKLEGQPGLTKSKRVAPSGNGWRSIDNWRRLSTKMSPDEVKAILGEPTRINGGSVAIWYYPNGGTVTFIDEGIYSWTEPNP